MRWLCESTYMINLAQLEANAYLINVLINNANLREQINYVIIYVS